MIRPDPCFRCGARGSCKHRQVVDVDLPQMRESQRGKGNLNSPWGAKGNPAGKARQRLIDGMKDQLR